MCDFAEQLVMAQGDLLVCKSVVVVEAVRRARWLRYCCSCEQDDREHELARKVLQQLEVCPR